jgi:hypothetical protein
VNFYKSWFESDYQISLVQVTPFSLLGSLAAVDAWSNNTPTVGRRTKPYRLSPSLSPLPRTSSLQHPGDFPGMAGLVSYASSDEEDDVVASEPVKVKVLHVSPNFNR